MNQSVVRHAVSGVPDMFNLPSFAQPALLHDSLQSILAVSPFRFMQTPRGFQMAAEQSNCGALGWVTDRRGYRYEPFDPLSDAAWPAMPSLFMSLASEAAGVCGFDSFEPDACLINRYAVGKGMSAHRDADEIDFSQPIVSVSLGLPARFFVQGEFGKGKSVSLDLVSGDVVVWGGASRLFYHGVRPLKAGVDSLFGEYRINLTFRRAI